MSECAISQLELFRGANYQSSVEGSYYSKLASTEPNADTLVFDLGKSDHYTDPSNIYINAQVVIKKNQKDGTQTRIKNEDKIGPVNNFLSSLFSQGSVYLNNIQIENSNERYGYKADIQNKLNYNNESKSTYLASSLYIPDNPGLTNQFNTETLKHHPDKVISTIVLTETAVTVNKANEIITTLNMLLEADNKIIDSMRKNSLHNGYIERRKNFIKNDSVELLGPLHLDITKSNLYLPPNVSIKIALKRSDPKFCLMGEDSTSSYVVQILSASLFVKRVQVSEQVRLAQLMALEKANMKLPLIRAEIRDFTIPSGVTSHTIREINHGQLPTRVIFGLVDNTAFTGSYNSNPYYYKHCNMETVKLSINDSISPYIDPIKLNFSQNMFLQGYDTLFRGVNPQLEKYGNGITHQMYKEGSTLIAFDLTPDECGLDYFNLKKEGRVSIALTFGVPTDSVLTCVVYVEYENTIQVDKKGNVLMDYKV